MNKKLLLLVWTFLICQSIFAQGGRIFGTLTDTTNYRPMAYSSVSLIRKDSVLVRTQFANTKGEFNLQQIKPDTYRILITRPAFADYEEDIILNENEEKNLGSISLITRENLLKEVLIKDRSAIKIKGDTTEFLVDSFLTNKNSNVEDLLKKLPGIQVDKNGKITAQGQEVKKVLVDGEEFFGNDPTVATRNLKAENVETVQVFDKKSDQAAFTGIDDGSKEKTINLTLKDEAKKGYFGKVKGGIGTKLDNKIDGVNTTVGQENRYENELMFNNFKGKRKVSVFSTFSNTNKTGLDWEDREKYMGGNNVEYDEASGYMFSYFNSDPNDFNGNGIPQTNYIGGFFTNKFNKEKDQVNFTATRKQSIVKGIDKNYTQYILPDTMYFNTQYNTVNSNRINNTANGKLEFKIDSLSTFIFKADLNQGLFDKSSEYISENYNENAQLVNKNKRTNSSKGTTLKFSYSAIYNKKFYKAGRSLSLQWDQQLNQNNSDGYILSKTNYGDSIANAEQNLDQFKQIEENGNNLGGKITYTEPLSKKWFLVTDADVHYTQNKSAIGTFNKSLSGIYNQKVDSLSNNLTYDIGMQKGGVAFKYVSKKINGSIGGRISHTNLTQVNQTLDTTFHQDFLNLFPAARFNYKISNSRSIAVSYNGQTRQPTLQQINPIQDISNPLVIYKGNPNLGQSFDNDISVNYNSYQALTSRSLYLSLSYSHTFNDFANYDKVDNLGRRVYETVNVKANQSINSYMYYYFEIKKLNLGINNQASGSYNKNMNFINSLPNTNNNYNLSYNLNLSYDIEEKLDINIGSGIEYNNSKSSLRPDVVTSYFTYSPNAYVNVFLPKHFEWLIDGTYNIRQQTAVFSKNNNTLIINASVSRKFLKSENLIAKIGVDDILNQNIGFYRNASSNYINENTYLVLKRYFMFSLTYNFTKAPGSK
ncbi:MAG: hypothetical protein CFE21_14085 [Bacteroidetes bacterium B1(2017)]|nr:MAG: hypothetical protein CFE21_14085 [Bacteroidetes bacterium B1(2017)]